MTITTGFLETVKQSDEVFRLRETIKNLETEKSQLVQKIPQLETLCSQPAPDPYPLTYPDLAPEDQSYATMVQTSLRLTKKALGLETDSGRRLWLGGSQIDSDNVEHNWMILERHVFKQPDQQAIPVPM
jgi:hypothetical protein